MARSPETVAVNVKVRRRQGAEAPRALSCPGVLDASQTFPDEKDEELARLFVLRVDRARLASVIQSLRDDPDVELAEEAGARHLIKPKASA